MIRLDNIGDFILWLDGARAIRKCYPLPAHRITLIAPASWGKFAALSGLFDELFEIDRELFKKDALYRKRTISQLRAIGFHTLINPTYSRSFEVDDRIIRSLSAENIIGHRGDYSNTSRWKKIISDFRYSYLVPVNSNSRHEIERNRDFGRLFDPSLEDGVPRLPEGMTSWPAWFSRDKPYFVLFAGASVPKKIWPLDRFSEIGYRIFLRTGWRVIICGGELDYEIAEQVRELLPSIPVENTAGRTTLSELAGLLESAKLVITNDTSAAHIAASLRTRTVCIAGGGHFGRFVPYPKIESSLVTIWHAMPCFNCNWICTHPEYKDNCAAPCVTMNSVDLVWSVIEQALS